MPGDKETKKKKKYFSHNINYEWCKGCGICIHFCPAKVYVANLLGKPEIVDADLCIGCKLCEIRCPDFAIEILPREEEEK